MDVDDRPLWIFGYGSLVWRPAFPHLERRPAFVRGWLRRFWQASTDHRGIPEAPGRVVTVLPSESLGGDAATRCWGMAYRVAARDREDVLARLDHRERAGYERVSVSLEGVERGRGVFAEALMYVATPANPNFVGAAPVEEIARIALGAAGPSGPNRSYVRELARALRTHGAVDEHVFAVDSALARLEREAAA